MNRCIQFQTIQYALNDENARKTEKYIDKTKRVIGPIYRFPKWETTSMTEQMHGLKTTGDESLQTCGAQTHKGVWGEAPSGPHDQSP